MSALAEACHRPFANGTEGEAWMHVWCDCCIHDHQMHGPNAEGPGCPIIAQAMLSSHDDYPEAWPEAWLPEPTGEFHLPSLLVCGKYEPCTEGACEGEREPEARKNVIEYVTNYWREQMASEWRNFGDRVRRDRERLS